MPQVIEIPRKRAPVFGNPTPYWHDLCYESYAQFLFACSSRVLISTRSRTWLPLPEPAVLAVSKGPQTRLCIVRCREETASPVYFALQVPQRVHVYLHLEPVPTQKRGCWACSVYIRCSCKAVVLLGSRL